MRKTAVILFVLLLMLSQSCLAAPFELVYTDNLGGQVFIDRDSVKPMTYKIWDCYKATSKVVFDKPMDNIAYSVLYYFVKTDNKDYAVVYIDNYDVNDKLISSIDKTNKVNWHPYDPNDLNYKLIEKILEISKEGK